MAAQPKNKITSVERGKRRHGNTPKLKKDPNSSTTPLHKRSLFGKLLAAVGGTAKVAAPENSKKAKRAAKAASAPANQMTQMRNKPSASTPVTKQRRTSQHKGV